MFTPSSPVVLKTSYILKQTCNFLDVGLLKYVWPFVLPGMKGLRELNICETKNCGIKVCELELEKWKKCGKIGNKQIFISFTYLFMDFILL